MTIDRDEPEWHRYAAAALAAFACEAPNTPGFAAARAADLADAMVRERQKRDAADGEARAAIVTAALAARKAALEALEARFPKNTKVRYLGAPAHWSNGLPVEHWSAWRYDETTNSVFCFALGTRGPVNEFGRWLEADLLEKVSS